MSFRAIEAPNANVGLVNISTALFFFLLLPSEKDSLYDSNMNGTRHTGQKTVFVETGRILQTSILTAEYKQVF